jgi:hypothetical protein
MGLRRDHCGPADPSCSDIARRILVVSDCHCADRAGNLVFALLLGRWKQKMRIYVFKLPRFLSRLFVRRDKQ